MNFEQSMRGVEKHEQNVESQARLGNINIKHACLSAMLSDSENLAISIERGVLPEWFDLSDRLIYESLLETFTDKSWDATNHLSRLHKVYSKHDHAVELANNIPAWAKNIESVDEALTVLSSNRATMLVEDMLSKAHSSILDGEDPFVVSLAVSEAIDGINNLVDLESTVTTGEIAELAFNIDSRIANGERMGLPFPWYGFQSKTFGIPPKTVTPIAGRDGKGKSRLVQFLTHHWILQGIPVLYFAFEDTKEMVMSNIASTHGRYDMFTIRRQCVPCGFMDAHHQSLQEIGAKPIYIQESACTAERIVSIIAKHKRKHGIQGVVIDGFKDIIASDGENRTQQENNIMGILVRAAKKYDVSIIPVSHLTKIEDRQWISKQSIKGSGNLTQSARMALVFQDCDLPEWLKSRYQQSDTTGCIVLDCQKANYGTKDVVVLRPLLEEGRFVEITKDEIIGNMYDN